ncbi:hypothetical protein CAOG_01490 [Capsaspora owczarzaki ATCC 30864]|uniref:Transmembrane protein 198 n=1 Tax=Capsaspora owczarzaki (strain ATCC 30864) TaxID=595528 RepID=A0A0D2VJK2_CAPO3|nr:hypothetical protein CAOG_01490 [Capsaspora owczarzaki ATCC 30864]KJE90142.1 hypothetical protein CAOG_001490 [Capsaspora owczarzaki ATCC 30864]|eukprot:XP_004364358.1 hypothetical protein CAOG_01490 [Capsaspora owczarzaki ATCC 30864]
MVAPNAPAPSAEPSPSASPAPVPVYETVRSAVLSQAGGLLGLLFCFFGYRLAKIVVFTGGFFVLGAIFYLFSPGFIKSDLCCGPQGETWAHLLFSALVGLVGGLIALKLMRFGLFCVGLLFGLIAAVLVLQTPLATSSFMENDFAFGFFYGGCALLFGLLAVVFEKAALVFSTAVGGAFAFYFAIDYWVGSSFSDVIVYFITRVQTSIQDSVQNNEAPTMIEFDRSFSDDAYILISCWLVTALFGVIVQYKKTSKGYNHRAQPRQPKSVDQTPPSVLVMRSPVANTTSEI